MKLFASQFVCIHVSIFLNGGDKIMYEGAKAVFVPFLVAALLCVVAELIWAAVKKREVYNFKETLCNLSMLVINRSTQFMFLGYTYWVLSLMEKLQPHRLADTPQNAILAIIFVDFLYYWEHRALHTNRLLWCLHQVHHSSPWFNFTASFRLHWLGRIITPIFFAPAVVAGFSQDQIILFATINLIYQFFLHTEMVGKLGFLEGIINTPSAHRVHHGKNEIYLDKNFGGLFMIWDRLFGTYQAEETKPVYGVTEGYFGANPFVVQSALFRRFFKELFKNAKQAIR
ncbi:MAG: sterol desaturase family protein [Candidatus Melainabacteria bacterium]|nr:sterol desaturase family protein [Candidatus Melainabacteria bacterium]